MSNTGAPPAKQNDLRRLQSTVPIITGPIANQARIGTWGAATNITTPAAGTEFTVHHPLGRIPNGWLTFFTALGGVVYAPTDGRKRWTTTTLILRSTVTGDTVSLLIL
jgi:hypothetical protein